LLTLFEVILNFGPQFISSELKAFYFSGIFGPQFILSDLKAFLFFRYFGP